MISLFIYLISTIGEINIVLLTFSIIAIISFVIRLVYLQIEIADNMSSSGYRKQTKRLKLWRKKCKKYLIISSIALFVGVLSPSSKTLVAMYMLPKMIDTSKRLADNKQLKQMPDKVLKILNGKLDEYIADFTNKGE